MRLAYSRNEYRDLDGSTEGKRPLRRQRRNIKMDLTEVGCGAGARIDFAQGRVSMVGLCKEGNEHPG